MNRESLIQNQANPYDKPEQVFQENQLDLMECFLDWLFIFLLILFTYALIVATFASCYAISIPNYVTGSGIYLLIFVAYVILLMAVWYFGSKQRESIKRKYIRMQLELEKKALE